MKLDKGSLNKWVNSNVENGLLEALNVHFFPLRGLREGGLFIAKGAAREKQPSTFLSFHPIIPFCCTLSDPESLGISGPTPKDVYKLLGV